MDPDVVVNRLVPPLDVTESGRGPLYEAAALHGSIFRSQQRWLEQLPSGPHLPFLFGLHTPSEVAHRLSEEISW